MLRRFSRGSLLAPLQVLLLMVAGCQQRAEPPAPPPAPAPAPAAAAAPVPSAAASPAAAARPAAAAALDGGAGGSGGAEHPCVPTATACAAPEQPAAAGAAPPGLPGPRPGGGPRLVEVGMKGCFACARMRPIVSSTVSRCAPGEAARVLEHVDVAAPAGAELGLRYKVTQLPTLLAVDASGAEVSRLVGAQTPVAVAQLVAEVTGRPCAAAPDAPR